jgi:putative oxidoreductase
MFASVDNWADRHHYRLLDLLRVILGITIFFKGFYFISHTDELIAMLGKSKFPWVSFAIAHYVAMIHLAGGVCIAAGVLTRIACALQIPVLLGAVLFVNSSHGFYSNNPDLLLSIVVLFLLVFYFIYGSGSLSFDHFLQKEKEDIDFREHRTTSSKSPVAE